MKIKIVRPKMIGWPDRAEGQIYDCVRINHGYKPTERTVSYLVIDDSWLAQKHCELVEEITDADYGHPWYPTP